MFSFGAAGDERSTVHVIELEGVINPVAAEFVLQGIEQAEEDEATCLIIEMDTPGGLMESMRMIVKEILRSSIPVVVYVSPSGSRAASAGVFITISAHFAAMAPGTNIGAAHPVNLGGQMDTSSVMNDKVVNDAVAYIRSIADQKGRNADWAEETVTNSISVTAEEALRQNAIDFVVPDIDSLLVLLDGKEVETPLGTRVIKSRGAKISRVEMSWRQQLLKVISDPNIAYILMMLGMYGLFFELYSPGTIFPGVVGAICIILAFYSFQTLPINVAGILLIALGAVLFILEIKVMSYGLLSIGGVISLLLGSVLLIDSPIPFLQISWTVILPVVFTSALLFIVLVGISVRTHRTKVVTGVEGLIGEEAVAHTDIDPEGQVMIHGEIWSARSDEKIGEGETVRVLSVAHLKMKVEKMEGSTPAEQS